MTARTRRCPGLGRPSSMRQHHPRSRPRRGAPLTAALLVVLFGTAPPSAGLTPGPVEAIAPPTARWIWPLSDFRLVEPYAQPAHRYGTGHRGIDVLPLGEPAVRAPADGVVAFAGEVAGRGVLTIEHAGELVTTLEPVMTVLVAGDRVTQGDVVAEPAIGGHAEPGTLHFGVRLAGEYINPLLLLGGVPRAVLLPCC